MINRSRKFWSPKSGYPPLKVFHDLNTFGETQQRQVFEKRVAIFCRPVPHAHSISLFLLLKHHWFRLCVEHQNFSYLAQKVSKKACWKTRAPEQKFFWEEGKKPFFRAVHIKDISRISLKSITALSLPLSFSAFLLSSSWESLDKNQLLRLVESFNFESWLSVYYKLDDTTIYKSPFNNELRVVYNTTDRTKIYHLRFITIIFKLIEAHVFSPWPPYWLFIVVTINFTERRSLQSAISLVVYRISQFGESTGWIILWLTWV